MKKSTLITTIIILAVLILSYFILKSSPPDADKELAKCIGENSIIYVQLGCHACEIQEKMFGENYQYLTVIDCFYDRGKCAIEGIEATPTWIIQGTKYRGVQSIEKLKELTEC